MSMLPNIPFITEAVTAASRISEMIDRIPLIDSEDERGETLENLRGEIEFREVSFSYPSRPNSQILQGFNLKVEAGKTVGLAGRSGSGKSTVISLLERFFDPDKGDILPDGCKIEELQLKWLRSQMALVNQEPILFATSIKENILFGKEGAPMELVIMAAKAANAHDFITELPQVGQFGILMSGGQKQRIAIARAIVREPRILLLDEATSALDTESERIVQNALDQASLGRTTIIIAHCLTTIRNTDTIVVLQSGRVIESGKHDELMKMNHGEGGAYFKMVQLQQSETHNEAKMNFYHPRGGKSLLKMMSAQSPVYARSSNQGSASKPFKPTLSLKETQSFEMHPNYDNDNENFKKSSYTPSSLRRLLRMNEPEWKRALLGCLGAAGFGAVNPVNSYCLGTILSVYLLPDDSKIKSETKFYCVVFLSLAIISFITSLLQHYNFSIMGENLSKRVREKILGSVLTFEIGWFDKDDNTSAAISACLATEANMVRSLIGDHIPLLVQVFTNASVSYTLALVVTWRLAIVMIAMQPLLIGCFYSKAVLMKSISAKSKNAQNEGSQLACEATVNHRTITAFSSQDRILNLFVATLEGPRRESIKQSWFSGALLFGSQFLTTSSVAMTYWYGGKLLNQGKLSSRQLFQAFFTLMSTSKNIADAGSITSDLGKGSSAFRSLFAVLYRKSEIEPDDPKGIKVEKTIMADVELKNVFFSYPSRPDQMIFKDLNLKIRAGTTVALVGQSSSGKSTIIALIERFYDPLRGSILVGGQDIKSYNLRNLRSHIALVSQEPTLFAGTVRQNIVYGKANATEDELREAATIANAHEFIRYGPSPTVEKEESSFQEAKSRE